LRKVRGRAALRRNSATFGARNLNCKGGKEIERRKAK
jgi:hypothetical protein